MTIKTLEDCWSVYVFSMMTPQHVTHLHNLLNAKRYKEPTEKTHHSNANPEPKLIQELDKYKPIIIRYTSRKIIFIAITCALLLVVLMMRHCYCYCIDYGDVSHVFFLGGVCVWVWFCKSVHFLSITRDHFTHRKENQIVMMFVLKSILIFT